MKQRKSVRRRAFRMENLEQRMVLSTAAVVDQVLHIEGDRTDNFIAVGVNEEGQITVDFDPSDENEPLTFDPEGLTAISIDGDRGNDQIVVDLSPLSVEAGQSLSLTIEGGQGVDSAEVALPEVIDGELSVNIELGQGNDEAAVVSLNDSVIGAEGVVTIDVDGGQGSDALSVSLDAAMIEGSLQVTLEGGAGEDSLSLSVTNSEIGAGASISASLEAGPADDALAVDLSGSMVDPDATVDVNLEGGPGANSFDLTLSDALIEGSVNLNVKGGPHDDAIVLDFSRSELAADALLSLHVDGGPGDDALSIVLNEMLIEGVLETNFQAGVGDDLLTIEANEGGQIAAGGIVSIGGDGGPGSDLLDDELLTLTPDDGGELNVDFPLGPEPVPPVATSLANSVKQRFLRLFS